MNPDTSTALPLSDFINASDIPLDKFDPKGNISDLLDRIYVLSYEEELSETGGTINAELSVVEEVEFDLPGLKGISIGFGGVDYTALAFSAEIGELDFRYVLEGGLWLKFDLSILRPAILVDNRWEQDYNTPSAKIPTSSGIEINSDWDISYLGVNEFEIPPCFIGDTDFVIEGIIALDFSESQSIPEAMALSLPNTWRGAVFREVNLHFPNELNFNFQPNDLSLDNLYIGSGGLTGSISGNWSPSVSGSSISGQGAGTLFGFPFAMQSLELEFQQNSIVGMEIRGLLGIPFFDEVLDIELGFDLDGNISVELGSPDGLSTLEVENVLEFSISHIDFVKSGNRFSIGLGGSLSPTFGSDDLNWPSFDIERLSIDSDGQIRLEGGWLNLPNQYVLDFYGFRFEISQLGFGINDDGSKWLGFSGGIDLVAGLPAGSSVDGLRVSWFENGAAQVSFEGIGVELEVPDAFQFKGKVSYRTVADGTHRFDGDILFTISPINLVIDAKLVVGIAEDENERRYSFMAIYLGVDLPAGLPLANSGLAIYGFAGLFALQMEPNKREDEAWYGIGDGGWYKRPEEGVADLAEKWVNEEGSLALGAGITLGTVYDNGFSFNGRLLFAIVFPGPIILMEGRANILKTRAKLTDEAAFKAVSILDLRENTFTAGLDAEYKYGPGGRLMLMNASAEVFFSFNDPSAWHLYLGMKEPREKRIRARSFDLFETNSYFMLDPRSVSYGLWVGYDWNKRFGPLRVIFEAWIEGNAAISFRPPQFNGDIRAHGKIGASVWRFRFDLGGDISLTTTVFDPFWLQGVLEVNINLPWPLPDFNPKFELEWGPEIERPDITPLPDPDNPNRPTSGPLKEIAAEHFKVPSSWALELRGIDEAEPSEIPVVPLDVRPHIAFRESVKDTNLIGGNSTSPEPPNVIIGDPDSGEGSLEVEYSLIDVALEKRENGNYELIASGQQAVGDIYGSWAPIPDMGTGNNIAESANSNTKLWIWSNNPFEYFRHNQQSWIDWYRRHHDKSYPCPSPLPEEMVCFDFEETEVYRLFNSFYLQGGGVLFGVFWEQGEFRWVENLLASYDGLQKGLLLSNFSISSSSDRFTILVPTPFYRISIRLSLFLRFQNGVRRITFTALSFEGEVLDEQVLSYSGPILFEDNIELTLTTSENRIHFIQISSTLSAVDGSSLSVVSDNIRLQLVSVCGFTKARTTKEESERLNEITENLQESLDRWSGEASILEPYSDYRLSVVTRQASRGMGRFESDFEEIEEEFINYVYFRTEGPPGLAQLSPPSNTTEESANSLSDLALYVERTIPHTTLEEGESPELPRPVYRAYDLGVEFNESYVHLMYQIANRGLQIYLFNSNNQPVRDAEGKLIVLNNYLGSSNGPSLTEAEQSYLEILSSSQCLEFDMETIPLNESLMAIHLEQVLDPDTVYEARLIPLLFEEGYREGLNDWEIITEGSSSGQANWTRFGHPKYFGHLLSIVGNQVFLANMGADFAPELQARFDVIYIEEDTNEDRPNKTYRILEVNPVSLIVTLDGTPNTPADTYWEIPPQGAILQTGNIWGGQNNSAGIRKPGTMLLLSNLPNRPQSPTGWSDYRYSVVIHTGDNDGVGVVFRYNNGNYYRFSMDAERRFRRLVKFQNNDVTLLAEDQVAFETGQDYLITVEAIQYSIRIYINGALLFDVEDEDISQGTIGLYCWAFQGARFSNIQVEDFSELSPTVFKYSFTTSYFVNFFHHLHSYQNEVWPLIADSPIDLTAYINNQFLSNFFPTENEFRAYSRLEEELIGESRFTPVSNVEINQIQDDGQVMGWFLRSPEPIDWSRTQIELEQSDKLIQPDQIPRSVKLIDVSAGETNPKDEMVEIMLKEPQNLNGLSIQYLTFSNLQIREGIDPAFSANFQENQLNPWQVLDSGQNGGPSNWVVEDELVRQTSNISTSTNQQSAVKNGTILLTREFGIQNGLICLKMSTEDNDEFGIVFRYRTNANHYRFVMNRTAGFRRIIRVNQGRSEILWQSDVGYETDQYYDIKLLLNGRTIQLYIDDVLSANVREQNVIGGSRLGLFCWANENTRFSNIHVFTLADVRSGAFSLLNENFEGTLSDEWEIVDEVEDQESDWQILNGRLVQRSNIFAGITGNSSPEKLGTYVFHRQNFAPGYRFQTTLSSGDNDGIGVLFAYQDGDNHYRFLMNRQNSYRQLAVQEEGLWTVLWEDDFQFDMNRPYVLVIDHSDEFITAHFDGSKLFEIKDGSFAEGKIGLFSWANTRARFDNVLVSAARWENYYEFEEDKIYADGTRIRIHTSGQDLDPQSFEGKIFVKSPLNPMRPLEFLPQDLRLRVLDNNGAIQDSNTFQYMPDLESVSFSVLRKRDGTGLFLLPANAASIFTMSSYSLQLEYRRDNQDVNPESTMLQQGGSRLPERVKLLIPWDTKSM